MIPITCVVPTRDEAEWIGDLVYFLDSFGCSVIVSDDSTDRTATAALKAGAHVVFPRGKLGDAYLRAWEDIPMSHSIVHVDAGGSHAMFDIQQVIDATRHGNADVVIGSRFVQGGSHDGGWKHRTLSKTAARISNLVSRVDVQDWTSGLRGYSQAARLAIQEHSFVCDGHAWQIEALDVCLRAGLTVREVPISYRPSSSQRNLGRTLEAAKAWRAMCS